MEINDVMLKEYEDFARYAFKKLNGKIGWYKFANLVTIDNGTPLTDIFTLVLDVKTGVRIICDREDPWYDTDSKNDYVVRFKIVEAIIIQMIQIVYNIEKSNYNIKEYIKKTENRNPDKMEIHGIGRDFIFSEASKYIYELQTFITDEIIKSEYSIADEYFADNIKDSKYFSLMEKKTLDDYYKFILMRVGNTFKEKIKQVEKIYSNNNSKFVIILKNKTDKKRLVLKHKNVLYDHLKEIYDYMNLFLLDESDSWLDIKYSNSLKLIVLVYQIK